jgi:hypothetical protein
MSSTVRAPSVNTRRRAMVSIFGVEGGPARATRSKYDFTPGVLSTVAPAAMNARAPPAWSLW